MLEAARTLFVELGYTSATIQAIAERADVSPEMVYASFGNKRSLLSQLVDISLAGDDASTPVLEQAWVHELRGEPEVRRRVRMLARQGRAILERRAAIDEVMRGAASADPEIAALWELGKEQRLAGQRELLRIVVGASALSEGLDMEAATDILYAVGSPETYRLLVVDRGWSGDRFEAWYGETLERLLIGSGEPA